MHLLAEAGRTPALSASGLLAAAVQGRQVEAIRVALEHAQRRAAGQEVKEPLGRATPKILPRTSASEGRRASCAGRRTTPGVATAAIAAR